MKKLLINLSAATILMSSSLATVNCNKLDNNIFHHKPGNKKNKSTNKTDNENNNDDNDHHNKNNHNTDKDKDPDKNNQHKDEFQIGKEQIISAIKNYKLDPWNSVDWKNWKKPNSLNDTILDGKGKMQIILPETVKRILIKDIPFYYVRSKEFKAIVNKIDFSKDFIDYENIKFNLDSRNKWFSSLEDVNFDFKNSNGDSILAFTIKKWDSGKFTSVYSEHYMIAYLDCFAVDNKWAEFKNQYDSIKVKDEQALLYKEYLVSNFYPSVNGGISIYSSDYGYNPFIQLEPLSMAHVWELEFFNNYVKKHGGAFKPWVNNAKAEMFDYLTTINNETDEFISITFNIKLIRSRPWEYGDVDFKITFEMKKDFSEPVKISGSLN